MKFVALALVFAIIADVVLYHGHNTMAFGQGIADFFHGVGQAGEESIFTK